MIDTVATRVGTGDPVRYGKLCWTYAGRPLTTEYHCITWVELPADYYGEKPLQWITNPDDDAVTYTDDDRFEVTDTIDGYLLRVNNGTADMPDWQLVEALFETRDGAQDYAEALA